MWIVFYRRWFVSWRSQFSIRQHDGRKCHPNVSIASTQSEEGVVEEGE